VRGDEGVREYLDLMNASIVIAHEPYWIEYLQARPNEYSTIWRDNHFIVFKRLSYNPSYALSGAISDFSFTSHSVTLTPQTESVVLKFKYFPFLTSTGCSITPTPHPSGLELIQLNDCKPGAAVTIKSVSPITRLLRSPS
jgi:hypothetical protein